MATNNPATLFAAGVAQYFSSLAYRWQDEKQYEDFAEYKRALKAKLPAGYVFVSLTKQPFAWVYRTDTGITFTMVARRNHVEVTCEMPHAVAGSQLARKKGVH